MFERKIIELIKQKNTAGILNYLNARQDLIEEAKKDTAVKIMLKNDIPLAEILIQKAIIKKHSLILPDLEYLLSDPAEINNSNPPKRTIYLWATSYGLIEVMQELEIQGANFSASCSYGYNALYYACQSDNLKAVTYLLEKLTPDLRHKWVNRNYGDFPLLFSVAIKAKFEILEILKNAGAEINALNAFGCSLLHFAIMTGNLAVVDTVLKIDVDLHQKTTAGDSPLMLGIKAKNIDIVNKLLQRKLAPDANELKCAINNCSSSENINFEIFTLMIAHTAEEVLNDNLLDLYRLKDYVLKGNNHKKIVSDIIQNLSKNKPFPEYPSDSRSYLKSKTKQGACTFHYFSVSHPAASTVISDANNVNEKEKKISKKRNCSSGEVDNAPVYKKAKPTSNNVYVTQSQLASDQDNTNSQMLVKNLID